MDIHNAISFPLKRLIDLTISGIALLVLAPFFLLITIAIKLESKGAVIFKQGRLGKSGRCFVMFKFRTMVENAENCGTGLFNYKNDPRVTKIGHILRKTSLDELPQLWNVLIGDMSLVGPRPPVSYELGNYEDLNDEYKKRFEVRPGITGLAQVSGRNELSWDEKVKRDNEYIRLFKTRGVVEDLIILVQTVGKVFAAHDIYEVPAESTDNCSETQAAQKAQESVVARASKKGKS
jgi:lipopolysaccharide/colanic/teichoic acid biosynthesis glycosyltransferase